MLITGKFNIAVVERKSANTFTDQFELGVGISFCQSDGEVGFFTDPVNLTVRDFQKDFLRKRQKTKKLPHKTLVTIKRFAQERLFNEEDGF